MGKIHIYVDLPKKKCNWNLQYGKEHTTNINVIYIDLEQEQGWSPDRSLEYSRGNR